MSEHGVQQVSQVTVAAAGSTVVTFANRELVEKLTVWASSGARTLSNMTFQPQINGVALGASSNVSAAVAALSIYTAANLIWPVDSSRGDPMIFSVLVSNAGAGSETVTLIFAGVGRDGGGG